MSFCTQTDQPSCRGDLDLWGPGHHQMGGRNSGLQTFAQEQSHEVWQAHVSAWDCCYVA